MIEFISGKLIKKFPSYVIIDNNGLGYRVNITLNTYNDLPELSENVFLDTYFSVTENSQSLYGFKDVLEKDLFISLISVSGIGPKKAISILSTVNPNEFKKRLIAGEVKVLTDLPGIGPKTAKLIIIELKDKFISGSDEELPYESAPLDNSDAYQALLSLGYKSKAIQSVINQIVSKDSKIDTKELIRKSLKKLR
tara:strand:+ start:2781 stop:3365 length:585 start_codon:yes stop_codon:yes gene_type:complete